SLLLRDDQVEEVAKKLSAALGVRVDSIRNAGTGYSHIVLPPQALNKDGHDRLVNALWAYQPGDQMPDLARALFNGSVTNPPGYPNTYAVIDPVTGEMHLSRVADFGSKEVSADMSRVSPERLKGMVRDGRAQEVDGYMYVAWIDPSTKQTHQMVFER